MERSCPVRNPDIVARTEQKEALLFNPVDGDLVSINGTGILVWDICDGSHTVGTIVREITERYEVSRDKAEEDCLVYLKELEGAGFIGYTVQEAFHEENQAEV
ncbi:MAG: PqqD family protein [Candidatus Omnitrophica bacterium]|nr:PqqD family protein [Candidatus Omnitrophota bacterium]